MVSATARDQRRGLAELIATDRASARVAFVGWRPILTRYGSARIGL